MNESIYLKAIHRRNSGRPPVWFMRQAGQHHSHYQMMRAKHSFLELCVNPQLSAEIAEAPAQEFNFDAAILFSGLLFPLDVLGMKLSYNPGPELEWKFQSNEDFKKFNIRKKPLSELVKGLDFQKEALSLLSARLPANKSLLGFVAGPATLFFYAVSGTDRGNVIDAKRGLSDGRYDKFFNSLYPLLLENMVLQVQGGAQSIIVMDSAAGEIELSVFKKIIIPCLRELFFAFRRRCPGVPITYYSKNTGPLYWEALHATPFDCLAVDEVHPIAETLKNFGSQWAIQGNFNPRLLLLREEECEKEIEKYFKPVLQLPSSALSGWICGLGDGVLAETSEVNIRAFMNYQKSIF